MPDEPTEHRLYGDLAGWWPLISPPEEYVEEAAFMATALTEAAIPVRDLLELGSGGGHVAVHLRAAHTMTLVDLSEPMLAVSRRLNPACTHHRGDMRTVRLDRTFDGVLVHDAIDYMTTATDLGQVIETAFVHCRPGGIALFLPDHTRETFEPGSGHGGSDGPDGSGARYLEWSSDPDPTDSWIETDYAFLLRDAGSPVRVVHETHRTGLFSHDDWLRLLAAGGFEPRVVPEVTDRAPRSLFVGHRPRGAPHDS